MTDQQFKGQRNAFCVSMRNIEHHLVLCASAKHPLWYGIHAAALQVSRLSTGLSSTSGVNPVLIELTSAARLRSSHKVQTAKLPWLINPAAGRTWCKSTQSTASGYLRPPEVADGHRFGAPLLCLEETSKVKSRSTPRRLQIKASFFVSAIADMSGKPPLDYDVSCSDVVGNARGFDTELLNACNTTI